MAAKRIVIERHTILCASKSMRKKLLDALRYVEEAVNRRAFKNRVLGYTYPFSRTINTYGWFIRKRRPPTIAGHLMHEYLHNCGFVHGSGRSRLRVHSVPYAVGYMVKEIAWRIYRGKNDQ